MADHQPMEGSSTSNASAGSFESTVELNVKTLDSQTYTFNVKKNIQVSALKDRIASQIGVPVEQQRLIFRGKVLKDDDLLAVYHVENGDTLHLVLRQSQSQPSSGTSTGEATTNNVSRGQEPQPAGGSRRIGQISHSVVLGTFNVGDQVEGLVPDLSRVIGAVLNTVGIGNMTGGQLPGGVQVSAPVPAPQGNENQSQTGSQQSGQIGGQQSGQAFVGQSSPQVVQIPMGAAIAAPSINSPIPDSLHTLTDFMNRMELVFSQNGYLPSQSPNTAADPHEGPLPTNSRGLPTPEALNTVLRHAERLFGGHVVAALSHIAGRLDREGGSGDPAVRGQVQTESVLIGQAIQHLGALLLELGRTILTLRMGQSPAESLVNAGPAVYISPSGPNPIMVQPFPLQTSSLFSGSTAVPPNPGAFGTLGIGNAPRHVNIHIHAAPITSAVGARTTNGDGAQGERGNGTYSVQPRVLPVRNMMMATTVPPRPAVIAVSSDLQPGQSESSTEQEHTAVTGAGSDVVSTQLGVSSVSGMTVPEVKSQGQSSEMPYREDTTIVNSTEESSNRSAGASANLFSKPEASAASAGESSSVPLGLGFGGLQPKKRTKQSRQPATSGDGSTFNNQNELPRRDGQQVLQSLAGLTAGINNNSMPSGTGGVMGNRNVDGQSGISNVMSQVLQSPNLNGLLSGVSQQSGAGSPDLLRNMLQQLTQSPAMMNTVGQIAQQIETQDLGSMFSGAQGGGGMDLSRMFQQMMPIVSQALGGISTQSPDIVHSPRENATTSVTIPTNENSQINLHEVAQRIEENSPPSEILRSLVQSTEYLHQTGNTDQSFVDEMCSAEDLANEFMQMLRNDVSRRFQDKQG